MGIGANPQSPIPNPQSPNLYKHFFIIYFILYDYILIDINENEDIYIC
ncbi:MAG: hypothetical protein MJ252_13975 [archaeon]|nr:hypothetical protein [archaeon]